MRRRGFTLIELLVVMGIIAALATMLVVLAPAFGDRQRSSRGASMLQSWLNLAKQRAIRDRRPVGIRLPHTDTTAYITELQYIEVPDEGVGGTIMFPFVSNGTPDYQSVAFLTTAPFTPNTLPFPSPPNRGNPQFSPAATIQTGDVISFPDRPMESYQPRRIVPSVQPVVQDGTDDGVTLISSSGSPPVYTYKLHLDAPLPALAFTTTTHVITRKARPVVGEPVLQLPKDIAIDVSNNATVNSGPTWYRMFPPTGNTGGLYPFDILFSPSGQVIGNEGNLGSRICLWVRDASLNTTGPNVGNDPLQTDPTVLPPGVNTLITVYTRTGHVTSHPVDPNGLLPNTAAAPNQWNPFSFTQDGLTSGNAGN
jgi:prepilin-type N-terminal cleavage/methylation domain-containing protein